MAHGTPGQQKTRPIFEFNSKEKAYTKQIKWATDGKVSFAFSESEYFCKILSALCPDGEPNLPLPPFAAA